jgi:hypothetical protein
MTSKKGVKGAYEWLTQKGYGKVVSAIKDAKGFKKHDATYNRRLLLVGLIYDKNLVQDFLGNLWIQCDFNHREDRLKNKFYRDFKNSPELQEWLTRNLRRDC